jgi:hypothetical protein
MTFCAWLLLYFAAQIIYVPFVWGTYAIVGPGKLYGEVYSLFTAPILVTVAGMTWSTLWDRRRKFEALALAFIVAICLARLTFAGLGRLAVWWDWLGLSESVVLLWAAVILGFMARIRKQPVMLVLAFYWTVQVGWKLGFLLHFPKWMPANKWFPPALGIVAFTTIGLLLRPRGARQSTG